MNDLFDYQGAVSHLHPNYVSLRDSPLHGATRTLINDIYHRMGDPNGTFAQDFQRHGFHARIFELAAFAYLEEAGFTVDHTHEQPDFLASKGGLTVCLEATTTNPPDGHNRDISILRLKPVTDSELYEKVYREFPRRTISSLSKKVRHRYQFLPQCAGQPLVVMVGPYFEPGSITYTDEALIHCLYGSGESYGPPLPGTPFFLQPHNRSISAVLFTNQFTVPRFFRLAESWPNSKGQVAVRGGLYYKRLDAGFAIQEYHYRLGHSSAPIERWHQGVTLFLNPNADVPMRGDSLPWTSLLSLQDGSLRREVMGFHTVTSFMTVSPSV